MQQQQAPGDSQGNFPVVIRMELDEKIDVLAKSPPKNSALVEKLFLLRCDIDTSLGAQSAFLSGAQKKVATTGSGFEDDADGTAEVEHCSLENTSQQIRAGTENESHNNRSRRMTTSEKLGTKTCRKNKPAKKFK